MGAIGLFGLYRAALERRAFRPPGPPHITGRRIQVDILRAFFPNVRPMSGRILLLVLCIGALAWAEDGPPKEDALEKEDKELQEGSKSDLAREVDTAQEGLGLNMVGRRGDVWAIFQVFGDVGASYLDLLS